MGCFATVYGSYSGDLGMTNPRRLNANDATAFTGMIFPGMAARLSELDTARQNIAVGALDGGVPVGLAYGEIADDRTGHVRSLLVMAPYRGRGIGTALLEAIETEFEYAGCDAAQVTYMSGRASTPALERVLGKRGWSQPEPETLICKTDLRMLEWSAYRRPTWLTGDYELFRWADITLEDREEIARTQAEESWVPEDLMPFQYENDSDPLTSLGIRYRGRPAGWLITHRIAPDTIRYTCSFIRKDLQGRFRIAPIYQEAFRRQTEAGIPNAIWMVPYRHQSMIRFVKKRWGGKFAALTESRVCSKSLAGAAATGASNGS